MDTTAALDTALNQESVIFFLATKIELPGATVRLLDGSSEITWAEGTFTGSDNVFGTLDNIEAISDGMDEQAPALSLTFIPPSTAAVASLASPSQQGSRIRIWVGALDKTTKAVVSDPYQLFDGVLDQPTLSIDAGQRSVEMLCASYFEKLFTDDESSRLNPACHKDVWPGETGLDAITGIVRQVIWGPGDKISGSSPGGSIGGGGFGGSAEISNRPGFHRF